VSGQTEKEEEPATAYGNTTPHTMGTLPLSLKAENEICVKKSVF
jgi:hypothetical protein